MNRVLLVMCVTGGTKNEILDAIKKADGNTISLSPALVEEIRIMQSFLDVSASDLYFRIREPKEARRKRPDDRWYRLRVKGGKVRPCVHRMPGHRTFPCE